MKPLPNYIFFETDTLPGAGFIMQLEKPFYIGKVLKFKTDQELAIFAEKQKQTGTFISGKPYDYRILINYYTSLLPHTFNTNAEADQVAKVFREMADFYLTEKIQPNAPHYKRYKE